MHGGSLEATSPGPGQGSTFTVRLPMTQPAASAQAAPDEEEMSGAMRVLVIDDNRDSADSATDVLRLLGNVAECAYDGRSGVAKARLLRPQMIFLDLAMPSLDGYETLKLLVEAGLADSYFVAMTGFGNADDKQRTREGGFHAHVTKPVELEVLAALLKQAEAHTQHGKHRQDGSRESAM
jgi:CheY-like chemotaxis protein